MAIALVICLPDPMGLMFKSLITVLENHFRVPFPFLSAFFNSAMRTVLPSEGKKQDSLTQQSPGLRLSYSC